ncbi:hypothetical protein COCON_G00120470 [Conger conger]|uniref:Uncharacterized protein n=1 Tax=Conger conger TaxID=82655 RepID=A0A9Q1HY26_CONCO|nr:hypothetical protein COCON_G00120470 [Conger conger]
MDQMDQNPISLQTILEGIHQMKIEMISHMDLKHDTIKASLNKIEGSLATLGEHVDELEQRVGSNEDNLQDLTQRTKQLEKNNAHLKERAEDAENRSRASNLRFISVPDKSEGKDILGLKLLIPQLLGEANFPTPDERCHRSPTFLKQNSRAGPRPILVKFLHFQEKLKIMKLSRGKKELVYNGTRVHIYPDFSAGLVQKRRQFDPLKKRLRDLDCTYAMIFPCTLKVVRDACKCNGHASMCNPINRKCYCTTKGIKRDHYNFTPLEWNDQCAGARS